jgi:cysteine synthase A
MKGAIAKAEELAAEIENSFIPSQFTNLSNPKAHYLSTGPEIYEDTDGKVDIFVAGVGTGGTITGTGKYLKEKNPNIKVIITQPDKNDVLNPIVKGVEDGGFHGIHAVHDGNSITPMAPANFSDELTDEYVTITYAETLKAIHLLAKYEGIFVGASSGASLAVAIKQALRPENEGKLIVPLLPDNGERYLSEDLQRVRPEVEDAIQF